MASTTHRDRVEGYIAKGVGDGAKLVTGGGRPDGLDAGWFVQPTIFSEVDNGSTIAQEEIFGPVLSVIRYGDTDDAVRLANDSDYGLGGSVWTSDPERSAASPSPTGSAPARSASTVTWSTRALPSVASRPAGSAVSWDRTPSGRTSSRRRSTPDLGEGDVVGTLCPDLSPHNVTLAAGNTPG